MLALRPATGRRVVTPGRRPGRIHAAVSAAVAMVLLVGLLLALAACGGTGQPEDPGAATSSTGSPVDSPGGSPPASSPSDTSSSPADSGLPKLVDLGSDSCIPCKLMAPELEALAQEYEGLIDVLVLDVYDYEQLARDLGIRVIPTQIWVDGEGNELARHEGYISKDDIVSRFQTLGFPLTKPAAPSDQQTDGATGGG